MICQHRLSANAGKCLLSRSKAQQNAIRKAKMADLAGRRGKDKCRKNEKSMLALHKLNPCHATSPAPNIVNTLRRLLCYNDEFTDRPRYTLY